MSTLTCNNPALSDDEIAKGSDITAIVVSCGGMGLLWALIYAYQTARISIAPGQGASTSLLSHEESVQNGQTVYDKVRFVSEKIAEGANAFLMREYSYIFGFMLFFSVVIILVIGGRDTWVNGVLTAIAFFVGGLTSLLSGYIGMKIAVFSNSRTCYAAVDGYGQALATSFRAAMVMGLCLVSLGTLILYILMNFYRLHFDTLLEDQEVAKSMMECIAGYGLGGSSVALFGRVGGGIYTKAADVGADLCGKLEFDIPEDDPRNPAVIADNVGDNVGDVAGMGADLFGSFAESTCAAMVIAAGQAGSACSDLYKHWTWISFPLTITATGVVTAIFTSWFAIYFFKISSKDGIEPALKRQILLSTVIQTPVTYVLCRYLLPEEFTVSNVEHVKAAHIFACIACGLWSGLIIGYTTEYYTSNAYAPVQEVAGSCRTGAATNIIYGLALGYKSVIIPVGCLAFTIYVSYSLAHLYGVAIAALGILSTLSTGLAIDAYGPICDNAGGIAEMSGMGQQIRERTDALDAAGNTTAAIGKGFAIGSAALVSLALFGGFITLTGQTEVNILEPFQFAGLLVGAMLPYWFSALTMKSVGKAALAMVEEVRRQFTNNPRILEGTDNPDYAQCVGISTEASLKEMMAPGALVMLTPLFVGFIFGTRALAGVLAGALVSGVQMAISSSNTGGAWDNAKKYIEGGNFGGKGSDEHKAAVVGDTVGDPLKDTSGPSLNILVKLMAIISLVFARSFPKERGYLEQLWHA